MSEILRKNSSESWVNLSLVGGENQWNNHFPHV